MAEQSVVLRVNANGVYKDWTGKPDKDQWKNVDDPPGHPDDDYSFVWTVDNVFPGSRASFKIDSSSLLNNLYVLRVMTLYRAATDLNDIKAELRIRFGLRTYNNDHFDFLYIAVPQVYTDLKGQRFDREPTYGNPWMVTDFAWTEIAFQGFVYNGNGKVVGKVTACWLDVHYLFPHAYMRRRRG